MEAMKYIVANLGVHLHSLPKPLISGKKRASLQATLRIPVYEDCFQSPRWHARKKKNSTIYIHLSVLLQHPQCCFCSFYFTTLSKHCGITPFKTVATLDQSSGLLLSHCVMNSSMASNRAVGTLKTCLLFDYFWLLVSPRVKVSWSTTTLQ